MRKCFENDNCTAGCTCTLACEASDSETGLCYGCYAAELSATINHFDNTFDNGQPVHGTNSLWSSLVAIRDLLNNPAGRREFAEMLDRHAARGRAEYARQLAKVAPLRVELTVTHKGEAPKGAA